MKGKILPEIAGRRWKLNKKAIQEQLIENGNEQKFPT